MFLSAIAGVMVSDGVRAFYMVLTISPSQITDYYVVRKGHYRVADLYDSGRNGWYWYTYGVNFRCTSLP